MAIRLSGSFRRYLIDAPCPAPGDEAFYEHLREQRFSSIDEQPLEQPSTGWIRSGSFSSSDFRPATVFFGPVILLRMRVDRKRLPANAVRVRLQEALADVGGRVAKSARDQMREKIQRELLARTVPSTSIFEVCWRPREGTLLLSSTAVAAHDLFSNLFRETFGSAPRAATPTPLAMRVGAPQVGREQLVRLAPISVGRQRHA